jgi:hypothetical protein
VLILTDKRSACLLPPILCAAELYSDLFRCFAMDRAGASSAMANNNMFDRQKHSLAKGSQLLVTHVGQ